MKQDKFEPTGEIKGAYDVAAARKTAIEHVRQHGPVRVGAPQGVELDWYVESARYNEDEDCYVVLVSCEPVDPHIKVTSVGKLEYHISAMGDLMPGTPRRRAALKVETNLPSYIPRSPDAPPTLTVKLSQPKDSEDDTDAAGLPESEATLLQQAKAVARQHKTISSSVLQRKLQIGRPLAEVLLQQLEREGVVAPEGSDRSRLVLSVAVSQQKSDTVRPNIFGWFKRLWSAH